MALVRAGDPRARQVPGDGDLGADATIARWQLPSTGSRPYRLPIKAPATVTTWAVPSPGALALTGGSAPARAVSRAAQAPPALTLAGLTPGRLVTRAVPAADDLDLSGLAPTASGWTASSTAPVRRWRGARRR